MSEQPPKNDQQPTLNKVSQPSRGEYRLAIESKQSRIDKELELLQPDIDSINLMLASLSADEDRQDELESYANSAIDYLNKNCELFGSAVTVSGHWYRPNFAVSIDDESMTFQATRTRQEVLGNFHSAGFTIGNLPPSDPSETDDEVELPPKVLLGFQFQAVSLPPHPSVGTITYQPVALANINEVSLTYVREVNDEIVSGNLEEISQAIHGSNDALLEAINDESLGFYDLDLEDQQKFFQDIIDMAESKLPDSRTKDSLLVGSSSISKMYIAGTNDGRNTLSTLEAKNGQPLPLTGSVVGFCITDEITNKGKVRYSSPSQLSATLQGIGIVVSPWPVSTNYLPDEFRGQDIIVPFNNVEDLEMQVI